MLYPYIYTGTRYHDFRVVTSQMLHNLPNSVAQYFEDVARAMIVAENSQLMTTSWILVKKSGYTLWGIAVLNKVLGNQCQDDDNRPVRGFFGFISDYQISRLPYDISYFKVLYDVYVTPIWDTLEQTKQIVTQLPQLSGFDFIERSSCLSSEINVDDSICRIFPNSSESKPLIAAVFASSDDCSIATSIHTKKQCVEFGKDKISFTNAIAATDLKIRKIEDVRVSVLKETPITIHEKPIEDGNSDNKESFSSICGRPVNENEDVCLDCGKEQRNKKNVKYGLYGFIVLICLMLIFNGDSVWKKIFPGKNSKEYVISDNERRESNETANNNHTPFLIINKDNITVTDATPDDVFNVKYESSSIITQVASPNKWIKIVTVPQNYAKNGVIEFVCEPLSQGNREGAICIINSDQLKVIISIHQTLTPDIEKIGRGPSRGRHSVSQLPTPNSPILEESTVDPSLGNVENTEPTTPVESSNH